MNDNDGIGVAVVQASAVPFDLEAAIGKVRALTAEAAGKGAQLVLFPEAYVGGYPWGLAFGTSVGGRSPAGRRTWDRYLKGAVEVPGPAIERIGEAAAAHGVHLAVGVVERDVDYSGGTLFCTLLYFGPDGSLLGKHRKLKPTAAERFIWGEGDGSTLTVVDTPLGRVGGLICWGELHAAGPHGHVCQRAWRSISHQPPTDAGAGRPRCSTSLLKDGASSWAATSTPPAPSTPADLEIASELESWPERLCAGGSAIYSPAGECLAGPLRDREGILVARLDPDDITRGKFDFDVVGHYARPDIFQLNVNENPFPPVTFRGGATSPG